MNNNESDVSIAIRTIQSTLGIVDEGKPWMYKRLEEAIETVRKSPEEFAKLDEKSKAAFNLAIIELQNAETAGENW